MPRQALAREARVVEKLKRLCERKVGAYGMSFRLETVLDALTEDEIADILQNSVEALVQYGRLFSTDAEALDAGQDEAGADS